jgi:hypothetical protein
MLRFIVMTCGYAEDAHTSVLIYDLLPRKPRALCPRMNWPSEYYF